MTTSIFLRKILLVMAVVALCGVLLYGFLAAPPLSFAHDVLVSVEDGDTVGEIAMKLKRSGIIKSEFVFTRLVILFGGESKLQAGDYFFKEPANVFAVSKRLSNGVFDLEPIKITIPEGLNVFEIAILLKDRLPDFKEEEFLDIATKKEGFLFPDTYFLPPNARTSQIVKVLEDTFKARIETIRSEINDFGKSIEEITTIASILETEAGTTEDRRMIAGILWKRLAEGMPLQVDVTFRYINGKNTYNLLLEDLDIDSPYNTYKYAGLPPTPIANPGLDSLLAAVTPIESKNYFFLADREGNVYYSETFGEHQIKKEMYVR